MSYKMRLSQFVWRSSSIFWTILSILSLIITEFNVNCDFQWLSISWFQGTGDTSGGCKCRVNGQPCHPKCGNCHWDWNTGLGRKTQARGCFKTAYKFLNLINFPVNKMHIFQCMGKMYVVWNFKGCIEIPHKISHIERYYFYTTLTSYYVFKMHPEHTLHSKWWVSAKNKYCGTSLNSLRPSDAYMRQWSNQHWFR